MQTVNSAQALNISLANVIGPQFPRIPNAGALYALLESTRSGGMVPDPKNGMNEGFVHRDANGKPVVNITGYQPDTAATSTVKGCEASEYAPAKEQFIVNMYRQTSFRVGRKELSALQGDAARVLTGGTSADGISFKVSNSKLMEEVRLKAMAKLYKLVKDIDSDVLTKIATSFGVNVANPAADKTTAKVLSLYGADTKIDEDAYAEILEDFDDNNMIGNPFVIGGRKFSKYARKMKWSSGAASGVNFDRVRTEDPFAFFKDHNADTILGAGNIAVFAPSMLKLVTYNEYEGIFAGRHANSDLGTLVLREFGDAFKFNLKITEEDCPEEFYNVMIGLEFDVYVPKNIYKAGDPHAGVNGLFRYSV